MVTPKQAYRATISLAYRRRLSEDIPELEATIRDYLNSLETDQTKIAGYRVIRDNGNLILEETEETDLDQLAFRFIEVNNTESNCLSEGKFKEKKENLKKKEKKSPDPTQPWEG